VKFGAAVGVADEEIAVVGSVTSWRWRAWSQSAVLSVAPESWGKINQVAGALHQPSLKLRLASQLEGEGCPPKHHRAKGDGFMKYVYLIQSLAVPDQRYLARMIHEASAASADTRL
jgi:hypothetical protein